MRGPGEPRSIKTSERGARQDSDQLSAVIFETVARPSRETRQLPVSGFQAVFHLAFKMFPQGLWETVPADSEGGMQFVV